MYQKRRVFAKVTGGSQIRAVVVVGLFMAALCISAVPAQVFAFSGAGLGTALSPFVITDCLELQEMQDDLDAYYEIANNIDCSGTVSENAGKGFDPVGDDITPFTGQLDGNSYTISGLFIERADDISGEDLLEDESYVGLFGNTLNAAIHDISLTDAKVKGYRYVGGLAGYATDTVFTNVNFNVSTTDNDCDPGHCVWARWGEYGGGIVGYMVEGSITDAQTGGPAKGSGIIIGGIVGYMEDATLVDASSTSNVDGGRHIGGAVGEALNSAITNVHTTGNILAQTDDNKPGDIAGGLVGYTTNVNILNSSATGDVDGSDTIGGLVGQLNSSVVDSSHSSGSIEATNDEAGGLIGRTSCSAQVINSYSTSMVLGNVRVGGLVGLDTCGFSEGTLFRDVYATGVVTGFGDTGGLIGRAEQAYIDTSYATGAVYGHFTSGGLIGVTTGVDGDPILRTKVIESFATGRAGDLGVSSGGLVGDASNTDIVDSFARGDTYGTITGGLVASLNLDSTITRSYSTGVNDPTDVLPGGVVPVADGSETITDTFWDVTNSGITDSVGGTGLTTAELKNTQTFVGAGWDMDDVWARNDAVNDGYPCLRWYDVACENNPAEDSDSDGVPDATENSGPNSGDANNDGTLDGSQPHVSGFINGITMKYVALEVSSGCSIVTASMNAESSNETSDSGFEYPIGLMQFTLDCGTPGYTATVKQYYYDQSPGNLVLRKYNPATHAYFGVPNATLESVIIDTQSVTKATFTITDGTSMDSDGVANGTIEDPSGLALGAVGAPSTGFGGTTQ